MADYHLWNVFETHAPSWGEKEVLIARVLADSEGLALVRAYEQFPTCGTIRVAPVMTWERLLSIRIGLILFGPFVLLWSIGARFALEMRHAFRMTWIETRIEWASARRLWRGEEP
jgi:hypothetical protein